MAIDGALIRKMLSPQRAWRKDDAFDAVFALRLVIALAMGTAFGALGLEGFMYFFIFLLSTFFGAKSWLEWQNIDVEEMESADTPAGETKVTNPSLTTEGLGPSVPLFMVRCAMLKMPVLHTFACLDVVLLPHIYIHLFIQFIWLTHSHIT